METKEMKTVREIALENPGAPAVLESLGIDYCCGGHLAFEEACRRVGKAPESVLGQLKMAALESTDRKQKSTDWTSKSLTELIAHIKSTHHEFVRSSSPRLLQLSDKVAEKHGKKNPNLLQVHSVFSLLAQELSLHLMKEEQILFPYVEQLEESRLRGGSTQPSSCFGSVENPITMMMSEHESAGEALRELRKLTNDYEVPGEACMSYRALLDGLLEFEADLHQHIHLENNILFPRAVALSHRDQ